MSVYRDNIHRYEKLLNSPNVINFLTEEGKQKYPTMKFDSPIQRNIWLINHLDKTKFTKLAKDAEAFLSQGLAISGRISNYQWRWYIKFARFCAWWSI